MSQLSLELDGIESKLKEAARAREAKLRRVRAPDEGRATMPFQLKVMDEVRRLGEGCCCVQGGVSLLVWLASH